MSAPPLSLALLGLLLGAAAFRLRGDASWSHVHGLPGNLAKLMFAGNMSALYFIAEYMTHELSWASVMILPAFYISCTVPSFGAIDAGEEDGEVVRDALLNLVRGLLMAAPPTLVSWWWGPPRNWPVFLLAGSSLPALYYAGRFTRLRLHLWGVSVERGPPWAEVYVGAAWGVATVIAGAA